MGIALMPWKLLSSYSTFIFGWLGGYAAFLGPVAGIMICDYFVIRRRVLLVDDLYLYPSKRKQAHRGQADGSYRGTPSGAEGAPRGAYEYSRGFNWLAVLALALGAGTALVGLVVPSVRILYSYSWFVGFAVSFLAYYVFMKSQGNHG